MTGRAAGYRHEAFLYRSRAEFVAGVLTFLRDGVAGDERVMVALAEPQLSLVRTALGVHGDSVQFMDMAALGANPARVIPAWLRFLQESCVGGRPARGVNESLWPGRRTGEVAECQLHEALLDQGVPRNASLWLRCPTTWPGWIRPYCTRGWPVIRSSEEYDGYRVSGSYGGSGAVETMFRGILPQPAPPQWRYRSGHRGCRRLGTWPPPMR